MAAQVPDDKEKRRARFHQVALTLFTAVLAFAAIINAMTAAFVAIYIHPQLANLAKSQFYQSGYSTRIGVTNIWKNGYPADARNRVSKFSVYYARWFATNREDAVKSVAILANQKQIFDGESIRGNKNLMCLLDSDLDEKRLVLRDKAKRQRETCESLDRKWEALSDNDLVEATLKYRNAIIECLNAMEAIQAIMDTRPDGLDTMPDKLEPRYRDLINDLTEKLSPFICKYRAANPRGTPPWNILMVDAKCNDIWTQYPPKVR